MANVEQLIEDSRGYAEGTLNDATVALQAASNAITGVGYAQPVVDLEPLEAAPQAPELGQVPTLQGAEFTLPTAPDHAPEYQDMGTIDVSGAPNQVAQAPVIQLPARPTEMVAFTGQLPIIHTDVQFPVPSDQLENPTFPEPVIADRAVPVKPDVVLPVFDKAAPVWDGQAPTDLAGEMERAYRNMSPTMVAALDGQVDALLTKYCPRYHSSLETLELKLSKFIDGGTALAPDVERALIERGRDRDQGEYRRVREAAWEEAAKRGFTLPSGALMSAIGKARQAAGDNFSRANTEIVVKQAEMEQQNTQFALTQSLNLRQSILSAMLGFHGNLIQINGQALDFAKTVANLLVETFNVKVRAFQAEVEAWRAEAAVYETRLKGALALIDLYKAEIDALQALTQVDVARVNVYRARIDSLQALASVYRTRVDAIVSKAQLEKIKIDLYGAQVQAYTAQTSAKANEWNGFKAAVDGEDSKVRLFSAQVQADAQAVTIWKAKVEAQVQAADAAARTNESRARQYEASWNAYRSVVAARGDVARTKLENERQELIAFQTVENAKLGMAQSAAAIYKARADVQIGYAEVTLRSQLGMVESMRGYQSVIAQLANTNADIHGKMAGMAMGGINSIAIKEG